MNVKTTSQNQNQNQNQKINDCPKCGGVGRLVDIPTPFIYCLKCHYVACVCTSKEEAINAWNRVNNHD